MNEYFARFSLSMAGENGKKFKISSVMNDPHGQTHYPASSYQYSHLKIVMFCSILGTDGHVRKR